MAKQINFEVSKPTLGLKTEVNWDQPENVTDARWKEVVTNPDEDINELACQSLVIKIQSGARKVLEEQGAEAAQAYVSNYRYGARTGGGFKRPTLSATTAKTLGFTEEQLAALRAAGMKIPTELEEAADTEAGEEEGLVEVEA